MNSNVAKANAIEIGTIASGTNSIKVYWGPPVDGLFDLTLTREVNSNKYTITATKQNTADEINLNFSILILDNSDEQFQIIQVGAVSSAGSSEFSITVSNIVDVP